MKSYVWIGTLAFALCICGNARGNYILKPSADTYVSSANAGTNYGGDAGLTQNVSANSNRRWFYISFSLASITDPIESAHLRLLQTTSVTGSSRDFDVYGLVSDKLTPELESTRTFTNDPHRSGTGSTATLNAANTFGAAPLTTFTSQPKASSATTGADIVFDVTTGNVIEYLNANLGGSVTFAVFGPEITGTGGWIWASKEYATVADRPTLTLTVPEPGIVGALSMAGIVLLGGRARRRR